MRIIYLQPMVFPNRFAHSIQVIQTCRALAERGVKVDLYVQQLNAADAADALAHYGLAPHANLTIRPLAVPLTGGRWRGPFFRLAVRRLCRRMAGEMTPGEQALLMIREPDIAERAVPVARICGVPVILEVHRGCLFDTEPAADPADRDKLAGEQEHELAAYRLASGIVCITEAHRRLLAEKGIATPMTVVPDGVAIAVPASATRDIEVIYAGQLYPWKGVGTAIAAMQFLPESRLTVVGGNDPGQLESHRALSAALGVAERVSFVGQVPPPAVQGYLARARVGVLPLPSEGFRKAAHFTSPLKLFEYMAAGLAIVASDVPSLREVLRHEEDALLVAPDDPKALAEGIGRALRDAPLAARLSAAACREAQQYSWPRRAERILDFARRVLKPL